MYLFNLGFKQRPKAYQVLFQTFKTLRFVRFEFKDIFLINRLSDHTGL